MPAPRKVVLADDQIAQMLKDGFASAEVDMAARSLREARVDTVFVSGRSPPRLSVVTT